MKNLTYLVDWGKNKETAWSGTNYSLFKALSKIYNITDVNINTRLWYNFLIKHILRQGYVGSEWHLTKHLRSKFHNLYGTVFQFNDILQNNKSRNAYMYMDNAWAYSSYLQTHDPKIYSVSGLPNSDHKLMVQRAKEQNKHICECSALFTMGHWLRDWLVNNGIPNDKVIAVGGGYNIDKKYICPQQKTHNKILFVGKDFRRKGGYITYKAFKLLRDNGEKVELYVIGPQTNPIKRPIDGYHFIGQIPFKEEAKYYNMCDIFCMPSYFEAYGLVFVEALTFGLPCIGRNCYEMPYFIQEGETGLLLNNDNEQELANLIYSILHGDSFVNNVLSHQQQYLHDYSWDAVAKRIANVIG